MQNHGSTTRRQSAGDAAAEARKSRQAPKKPASYYVGTYVVMSPRHQVFHTTYLPRPEGLDPKEFHFDAGSADTEVVLVWVSESGKPLADRTVSVIIAASAKCRWTSRATYLITEGCVVGSERHPMRLRVDIPNSLVWIEK